MNIIHKGIDVSKYQKQIDWGKVDASGIDFALIRIGLGNTASQKDSCFDSNVKQALAHGLLVGGYYFSYATSTVDAQKEADVCNRLLQPYKGKMLYPIAYDYEYDSMRYFKKVKGCCPTSAEIDSFARAFLDRLKSYGWFVNIYTNNDFIRSGKFSAATVNNYDVWLADYSGGPDYPCFIQQTDSKGRVPGISGNVDIDVSFKDYPTIIKAKGYNGYPKQKDTVVICDTTGTKEIKHGDHYVAKFTGADNIKITVAYPSVTVVVPVKKEDGTYAVIVPIDRPGQCTGIYTCVPGESPVKQFVVKTV